MLLMIINPNMTDKPMTDDFTIAPVSQVAAMVAQRGWCEFTGVFLPPVFLTACFRLFKASAVDGYPRWRPATMWNTNICPWPRKNGNSG
mgnify:FL=1